MKGGRRLRLEEIRDRDLDYVILRENGDGDYRDADSSMTMGATGSTMSDGGSNGADSGRATDLGKTLGSDSRGLRGSRGDDLRMRGRKGKADSHSLLY